MDGTESKDATIRPDFEAKRDYTTKQMGDVCEMLVAAELTLAGVPAMKAPEYWPGYDVVAQPPGADVQRISVKARTFLSGAGCGSPVPPLAEALRFTWLRVPASPPIDSSDRQIQSRLLQLI